MIYLGKWAYRKWMTVAEDYSITKRSGKLAGLADVCSLWFVSM